MLCIISYNNSKMIRETFAKHPIKIIFIKTLFKIVCPISLVVRVSSCGWKPIIPIMSLIPASAALFSQFYKCCFNGHYTSKENTM